MMYSWKYLAPTIHPKKVLDRRGTGEGKSRARRNNEGDNPSMGYVVLPSSHPLTIKTYFCAKTAVYRCQSVECFLNLGILNMLFQNPAYRLARHKVFCFHCIRSFGRERSFDRGACPGRSQKRTRQGKSAGQIAQGRGRRENYRDSRPGAFLAFDCLRAGGWACHLASCVCTPFQNQGKGYWNTIEGPLLSPASGAGRCSLRFLE